MVNVANTQVHVDGVVMSSWSTSFTHKYTEYTIEALYGRGRWTYSIEAVGYNESTIATLVVSAGQRQRAAVTGLLVSTDMDYATASEIAGEIYNKIKSCLEQLNPLYM